MSKTDEDAVGCIFLFGFVFIIGIIGVPLLFVIMGLWWQAMKSIWNHF